jgi:hypothetical protein
MKIPFLKTTRQATVAGVVAVACGVSGIAVAAGSHDSSQQRLASSTAATAPASTPAAEASAFGVLRSAARPVPAAVSQAFAGAAEYKRAFAPNPSLGRPLASNPYTGTPAWLVPADDGLCLYVPDTEGAAITCKTLDEAKAGQLYLVMAPAGKASFAIGVVPEGVDAVQVGNADGSSDELAVSDNTYSIRSAEARSVTVGGTVMQVPQAPKTLPALPPGG